MKLEIEAQFPLFPHLSVARSQNEHRTPHNIIICSNGASKWFIAAENANGMENVEQ